MSDDLCPMNCGNPVGSDPVEVVDQNADGTVNGSIKVCQSCGTELALKMARGGDG